MQTRIVEMNPVVFKDVPSGNQYNFEVANEGVVRHLELPGQDALEGIDSRMGNEIVLLTCHHHDVVAILLDIDADVVARHSGWWFCTQLSCCCVLQ